MEKYKKKLLKDKTVSVWGTGYLGYTEIIRLQSKGFKVSVFSIMDAKIKRQLAENNYPDKECAHIWSERGFLQPIDVSKINVVSNSSLMFRSNTHIMAFPVCDREGRSLLKPLLQIFIDNKSKLSDSVVIFLSVGTPGEIRRSFIEPLIAAGVRCGFASAFRTDWTIEEFFSEGKKITLAANDEKSFEKVKLFYKILGIKYKKLSSIEEAEIYLNAKNSFQYLTTVFINQLALSYPNTNIRSMTEHLLEDIELNETYLSLGSGGVKMPRSIQNILDGSERPEFLTLIKDVQNISVSMVLHYAELVKKIGCTSATLLGVSVKGDQKNIELSNSIILAEYLHKIGVKVYVDDPFYDKQSLSEILPQCIATDIVKDGLQSESLFVMNSHSKYRYLTQSDIDALGICNAKIIIDSVPLFAQYSFCPSTIYYTMGDGTLGAI